MALNVSAIAHQLGKLLPRGAAWPRTDDSNWHRAMLGLAEEVRRVEVRVDDLIRETDVRTAIELLPEWEAVLGLPDPCLTEEGSIQERRNAAHARLTSTGGQSRAYYIGVAASLGFDVTITEFWTLEAGDTVGQPVAEEDWPHYWRVNAPEETVVRFRAGQSASGEELGTWGNELLECTLSRIKPAHTALLFGYGA